MPERGGSVGGRNGHRGLTIGLVVVIVAGCRTGPSPATSLAPVATTALTATASASPGPSETPDPASGRKGCTPKDNPTWTVARRWNEALLDAIRRSLPNPPVHARNLFHVSVAMWDAWATYDPIAAGYVSTEKISADDVRRARNEAISYAAWGVLRARFQNAVGGEESLLAFDALLKSLCYDVRKTVSAGGVDPAAVGTRIAREVLGYGLTDGANEAGGYGAPFYSPVNEPLVVAESTRFELNDVNRWQPLEIVGGFSQNGIPTGTVQVAIAPHWGRVAGFGATFPGEDGAPIDPGPPPLLGDLNTDAILKDMVVEVIRDSSLLDVSRGTIVDVAPSSRGSNSLGSDDGHGYRVNPVTGKPYTPQLVNEGDFLRVMAEFWADGPRSETPPGHWNVIANHASDAILAAPGSLHVGGAGPIVDRLEWDVKLYLALNGAVHDAAIVAWGLKGKYDSIRPISLIRYMGRLGQSTDPDGRSYDPNGLPLVPGLIEVVTAASSARGERHAALSKHVGRVAILAWGGTPDDPSVQVAGTRWMLATAWVPYQLPSFVTPSFPGYVSGHSTFSRAAAEVLAAFTATPYFPGGLASYTTPQWGLAFEHGPTTPIALEWATYYDAADQAGQSRLFGGIHIRADDFAGRELGSKCGIAAWQLAGSYFAGAADSNARACVPTT